MMDFLTFEGKDRKEHKGNTKTNPVAFGNPPNDVASHGIISNFSPASSTIVQNITSTRRNILFCLPHKSKFSNGTSCNNESGGNESANARTDFSNSKIT